MERPPSVIPEHGLLKLARAASLTPRVGAFVEVGVYCGGSASYLYDVAREQGRPLYLYDTFTGIPFRDDIDHHRPGDFSDTNVDCVRARFPEARVVHGIFPASAVPMEPIAFAHIDCDQYRSVKESAEFLRHCMVEGGLMWFDDYGCLDGATKAVDELFAGKIETMFGKAVVRF